MKSFKVKLSLIIALAFVFVAMLGAFLGVYTYSAKADRYVQISGTSIFYTSGSSQVWAHKEDDNYFTMFTFERDSDTVTYRRNLAYSWFYDASEREDDSEEAKPVKGEGYLYLEIGFEEVNFEKFTVTFEGQEYNATKENKTVNYVVFVAAGEGKLFVEVTDDKEVAEGDIEIPDGATLLDADHIVITLDKATKGEYPVEIYNVGAEGAHDNAVTGKTFKNVGKTFAKYVSSSTNPVTPLSFGAEFAEAGEVDPDEEIIARMALYNLNGQSFKLEETDSYTIRTVPDEDGNVDHYSGGAVNDTTPPVLCLTSGLTYIGEGSEITFQTTVIDVLTQSPSTETGYYMLTKAQAATENFNSADYENNKLFKVVKDSDDQYMIAHADSYVPVIGQDTTDKFDKDFNPVAAVKVYVKLTDIEGDGSQSTFVMLDWYIDDDYLISVGGNDYIAVATDKVGASYNYTGNPDEDDEWQDILDEYQALVTEAAEDLEAGSENKIYLPDASKLFSDNATAYEDMTYSIYFNNGSQSSDTGNASNSLSINLNKASTYIFTIYAHDSKNNEMWYEKDGKVETFATSDVWTMFEDKDEEGLRSYLPWFTFEVAASEISVEDPGEQDTAYVGTEYTASSFEINGVAYEAKYTLYLFDNDGYYEDNKELMTYEYFMANKDDLFENHRKYFTLIRDINEIAETDEDYETMSPYGWDSSTRSFTPQKANTFYLIKCEVTSTDDLRPAEKAYMGIAASARPRTLAGENTWVEDNAVSIVLLSIAGASLIGIILLLVIKPKNKGDIDEQFEAEKTKKLPKEKQ